MSLFDLIPIVFFLFTFFILYKIYRKEQIEVVLHKQDQANKTTEAEWLREIKIRKHWLISFYLTSFLGVFSFFSGIIEDKNFQDLTKIELEIALILATLIMTPLFYITYHCSFKKRGTVWLTLTIISFPFNLIKEISSINWKDIVALNTGETFFIFLLFLLMFGVEMYFIVSCFQLRKINAQRKKSNSEVSFKHSNESADCALRMENSENIENLNEIYGYAIGKWPQWEKVISEIYNKRKNQLLENN
ncbi:MAG: hypothetical protein Tsb0021_11590 [Chlamydiales bacterium]